MSIPDDAKPPLPPGARRGPPKTAEPPKLEPGRSTAPRPGAQAPKPGQAPPEPPRIPPKPFPPSVARPPQVPKPPPVEPPPSRGIIPSVATAEAGDAGVVGDAAVTTAAVDAGVTTGVTAAGVAVAVGATVVTAAVLAGIGVGVYELVKAIGHDNDTRAAYTQQFVATTRQKYPNYNVVIIHTQVPHSVSGPQIVHQHHEINMSVGTCGYDSYASPMGQPFVFENQGDGGYINWAYAGQFTASGNGGKILTAASSQPAPKAPAPPARPQPVQHLPPAAGHGPKTA
jgi:hypothetical protein